MTNDGCLKLVPENLVDRGDWVNISGCRGMVVSTKNNFCYGGCWCIGGMERPYGAINEEPIDIRGLT